MAADLRQFDLPMGRQPLEVRRLRREWEGHAVSPISGAVRGFTADGQAAVTAVGTVLQDSLNAYRMASVAAGTNLLRAPIPNSSIGVGVNQGAAFLVQFRTTSTAVDTTIAGLGSDSGGSGNTIFRLGAGSGAASRLRATVGNVTNNTSTEVTGSVINDGLVHTALVSLDAFNTSGSCTYSIYLDGLHLVDQTDAVVLGASHAYNWVCAHGLRRTTDSASIAGQTALAVGFRRRVSRDQGIALTRDPWGTLFQQRRIIVPVAAAGGGTNLTLADASHAHAADNVVLTTATTLAVADCAHSHAADNVALVVGSVLTVAEASHAHAADALTLTTDSTLAVAETTHAHAADNVALEAAGSANLAVEDATHAHTVDALVLTSAHALIVADSTHSHTVDGLTLTAASVLAIQEALHAHAADGITLDASGAPTLLLADALHAHTSDGVALTVAAWLTVADATHGHAADNVVLSLASIVLSAAPIGHGPAMSRRTSSFGARRPQQSTRTR